MRASPLLVLTLLAACGQEVVPPPCADHDAATPDPGDAAGPIRADAQPDGGLAELDATALDATALDASPTDAGDPRCPDGLCFTLAASATVANVREIVTLTPTVDNPGGRAITFSVVPAELVATRRPGRPALVVSDIGLELSVDSTTGVASLRIAEVPPWFIATTFRVRVHATAGSVTAYADAEVHIRGNTVLSATYSDVARVYAVASDGRPARARMPGLMQGELITQLARSPAALLMSRDGSLIVHDTGATPPRLMRFELTGHDQQLATFDYQDAGMMPYLGRSPTYPYSLAELPDGRVVVADYDFSRTQRSRLVVFGGDGAYRATLAAPDPMAIWTGIGVHASGDVLLSRLDGTGRVERIDPDTGALRELFADALPNSARAVLGMPDGATYISGDGYVIRVLGRQRSLVNMLPGSSGAYWRMLAPYSGGLVLAATDERSDTAMPVLIRDRQYLARLRAPMAGNVTATLRGVAYLE